MKISDLLDVIEDDTVPLRERDIIASERIMEATMAKLQTNHLEADKKKHFRNGAFAAIIAAAVVLALAVTALAAGNLWKYVNWNGEELDIETEPMATAQPETAEIGSAIIAMQEEIGDILSRAEPRELVIARREDGSCDATSRSAAIDSPEELESLLAQEGSALAMPFSIPEDFAFTGGYVYYQLAAGYDYTLISAEERDGYTVERYAAPPEGDFISSYTLRYTGADGTELSVMAQLHFDAERFIGYADGDRVEALTVDGMENALLLEGTNYARLMLRQTLAEPIPYTNTAHLMDEMMEETEQNTQAVYEIYSTSPDADGLLGLLAF